MSDASGEDLTLAILGIIAAGLLVLSPWLVDQSGPDPYYKGPLIYPQIVLAVVALAAVPAVLRFLRRKKSQIAWLGMPRQSLTVFVLTCLYPVAIAITGLLVATLLAVGLGLRVTGMSWRMAALVGAATATLLWLLFIQLLDIWFPEPWLLQFFES